jgi:colanic acid/amylovoran biosynthesis glycosyltransferase
MEQVQRNEWRATMNIVVFTATYPYDSAVEQSFLDTEIELLSQNFDRVILIPRVCKGNLLPTPAGVELITEYAAYLTSANKLAYIPVLFTRFFYQEILSRPSLLRYPFAVKKMVSYLSEAILTKNWLYSWIKRSTLNVADSIFYTFWFTQVTMAIGMAKSLYPKIKLVSRAHGGDLYEERHVHSYIPCRKISLGMMDGLLPDSQAGTNYLHGKYSEFSHIIDTSRMGTPDPGFVTNASEDGIVRIVSCALIRKDKRIDLLLQGIALAAQLWPKRQFVWHHFGNGIERESLQLLVDMTFPSNAKGYLPGYTTRQDLYDFYRDNPIDVFMLTSKSEGTPVAVMEAISCGLPIIATAVGGNTEIVSEHNGILLPPDPTPEQIAHTILAFIENPEEALKKRKGSFQRWQDLYSVKDNTENFIRRLKEIRSRE